MIKIKIKITKRGRDRGSGIEPWQCCGGATPETPECEGDFVLHGADGESITPQDCPEIEECGGGRGDGLKAVEGYRSPSPGGIADRLGADEHPWGLRRGLSEQGGGLVGLHEIPESGCEFVLHGAGGEWVTPRVCPEFSRSKHGLASENCRRGGSAADFGFSGKRTGFCHPSRVGGFLTLRTRGGAARHPWLLEWPHSRMQA